MLWGIGLILVLGFPLFLFLYSVRVRKRYWKDYIRRRAERGIDRDQ